MLKNYLIAQIRANFEHEPTTGQIELIDRLADFMISGNENLLMVIKGYAGTGKTSIVGALVKVIPKFNLKSILLAPTGRAAKVLSNYSGKEANTIHKKIYVPENPKDNFGSYRLDKNKHSFTIFIVDEASMISSHSDEVSIFGNGRLLDDLIDYVYNGENCKLILMGDTAQLPPVGLSVSPALDIKELERFGKKLIDVTLTDVVRQAQDSGILYNATNLRNLITGFSDPNVFPQIKIKGFEDVFRIDGRYIIDEISGAYDKNGTENTIVISRSNKIANRYNQGIRNSILGREEEISSGDLLMVVKNNYFWLYDHKEVSFIANGDIVQIKKVYRFEDKYGFRYANVCLRLIDYVDVEFDANIMLDTLSLESASLPSEEQKKLFLTVEQEFEDITNRKTRYKKIKEHPYFNALQVKFAYSVTCHKAQGGQWNTVFIDQSFMPASTIDLEYLRWLYTAFTRSTQKVYLVNFKDEFFEYSDREN